MLKLTSLRETSRLGLIVDAVSVCAGSQRCAQILYLKVKHENPDIPICFASPSGRTATQIVRHRFHRRWRRRPVNGTTVLGTIFDVFSYLQPKHINRNTTALRRVSNA